MNASRAVRAAALCCVVAACQTSPADEIAPDARLRVAFAAENSGNVGFARSMYAAAAAEGAGDRTIGLRAAAGLARSGGPADAMAVLDGLTRSWPKDLEARRMLGTLQIMNGLPGEAHRSFSTILAARPDDDDARINLGVALDMLGHHPEARVLYRAVLAKTPSDPRVANDLALSLLLSGQRAEAGAVLQPFRGRLDLPERMQSTMALLDGTAAAPGTASADPADPGMALMSRVLNERAAVPDRVTPAIRPGLFRQ